MLLSLGSYGPYGHGHAVISRFPFKTPILSVRCGDWQVPFTELSSYNSRFMTSDLRYKVEKMSFRALRRLAGFDTFQETDE